VPRLSDVITQDERQEDPTGKPQGMRLGDVVSMPRERGAMFEDNVFELSPERQANLKLQGPMGAWESWERQDKSEMIPFNPEGAVKQVALLDAVNRLKQDPEPETRMQNFFRGATKFGGPVRAVIEALKDPKSAEERRAKDIEMVSNYLEKLEEERIRGVSFGGKVVRGVSQLPGFMVEFLATGGLAALGKKAVNKGLQKVAKEAVDKGVMKFAAKTTGMAGGAVARTAAMPHRVIENAADRQINASLELTEKGIKMLKEANQQPGVSLLKGVGDTVIENFSEETGAALTKGIAFGARFVPKAITNAITKAYKTLHPGDKVSKLFTAAGWNGFIEELGEERIGGLLRAVTGIEDFGTGPDSSMLDRIVASIPNGEEFLVEAAVLAFPSGVKMGASQAVSLIQRRKQEEKIKEPVAKNLNDQEVRTIVGEPTGGVRIEVSPEVQEFNDNVDRFVNEDLSKEERQEIQARQQELEQIIQRQEEERARAQKEAEAAEPEAKPEPEKPVTKEPKVGFTTDETFEFADETVAEGQPRQAHRAIIDEETGEVVGGINISDETPSTVALVEMIEIKPEARRKGFAKAAIRQLFDDPNIQIVRGSAVIGGKEFWESVGVRFEEGKGGKFRLFREQFNIADNYTPDTTLTGEEQARQEEALTYLLKNFRKAEEDYRARVREEFKTEKLVSGDEAKFIIPGVNKESPEQFRLVHEPASAFAKMYRTKLLADQTTKHLPGIVMGGGSGAGKSSGLKQFGRQVDLDKDVSVILDTNTNTINAARKNINVIRNTGRSVTLLYVERDPVESWKSVIDRGLDTGRPVPLNVHIINQGARRAFREATEEFKNDTKVDFIVLSNVGRKAGEEGKLGGIELLLKEEYTTNEKQQELARQLNDEIDRRLQEGSLTETQAETFRAKAPIGQAPPGVLPEVRPGDDKGRRRGRAQRARLVQVGSKEVVAEKAVRGLKLTPQEAEAFPDLEEISETLRETNARIKEQETAGKKVFPSLLKKRQALIEQLGVVKLIPTTEPGTKRTIREQTGQVAQEEKVYSEQEALRISLRREARTAAKAARAAKKSIEEISKDIAGRVRKALPPELRGKFSNMIAEAKTREDIARAIERINQEVEKNQRKTLVKSIKKQFKRIVAAKNIDITFIQRAKELMRDFDLQKRRLTTLKALKATQQFINDQRREGKDVDIPIEILQRLELLNATPIDQISTATLRDIASNLSIIADLGKVKLRTRKELRQLQHQRDLADLEAGSQVLETKDVRKKDQLEVELAPDAGGVPITEKINNLINRAMNWAQSFDLAITPMDAIFDHMDGNQDYNGANHRIFKQTVDRATSAWVSMKRAIAEPIKELADSMKMTDKEFHRIGFFAAKVQEGGREKLLQLGVSEKFIDSFTLNEREMQLYSAMRKALDDLRAPIAEVMRTEYNKELGTVVNYFPFLTDFKKMSDSEIRDRFGEDTVQLKTEVQKGFTIARFLAGKQKIKLHAMDIFLNHIDNATYLATVGKETPRLGRLARSEAYRDSVGGKGQEITRKWIDLIARKGGAAGERISWLDTARRNVGFAVLGYKLSSMLVQFTAILDGAALIGPRVFEGAYNVATSSEWRKFLQDHSPELRDRGADDPAFLEFDDTGGSFAKFRSGGFYALKKFDLVTAASTLAGAYSKIVAKKGKTVDFENVDKEAMFEAERLLRRTQSSSFFKDSPLAISAGGLTGNISIDKAILQFQSFMLNRWSLIRHDMMRAGIMEGQTTKAMNIAFYLTLATFAEYGIRRVSNDMLDGFFSLFDIDTDFGPDDEESTTALVRTFLGNIPVISQIQGFTAYGSVPVPAFSLIQRFGNALATMQKSKKPETKAKHALRAALLGGGSLFGIPGTIQAEQIARETITINAKRGRGRKSRRSRRTSRRTR